MFFMRKISTINEYISKLSNQFHVITFTGENEQNHEKPEFLDYDELDDPVSYEVGERLEDEIDPKQCEIDVAATSSMFKRLDVLESDNKDIKRSLKNLTILCEKILDRRKLTIFIYVWI